MVRWVGAQGQVNLAKKAKTCPHCDVRYPQETPNPKWKKYFLKSELEELLNP